MPNGLSKFATNHWSARSPEIVKLAGVDLAWQSSRNPTAIAVGELSGSQLSITEIYESLYTREAVMNCLLSESDVRGVAIDAPLIINNVSGQRQCERDLGSQYSSRHASCHTSNLTLYPNPDSVVIASELVHQGFKHLGSTDEKWQLECYPHPAIIELFGLPERLKYKKGRVSEKREGQVYFSKLLMSLTSSPVLQLKIPALSKHYLDTNHIRGLKGRALKHNEDVLDAILCLYIAGLFQLGITEAVFGDVDEGYIYVPVLGD